jgi:hypothetical protein
MPFETTIRAFAAALAEPYDPPPAMTRGRKGAPDARRFSVYRNNVAVGLIGALEARYPVFRRLAGDDLFRALARAFVQPHKPRSPVMIAYGEGFPEFISDYLARDSETYGRVSSPLVGEEQGGGSRRPARPGSSDSSGNSQRDPPPLPAPARGGGCASRVVSCEAHHALACLADIARLENAWVEAYHAEDATAASLDELAALSPDCLPGARIAFHPAARLLRFSTPAASVWALAQTCGAPAAPIEAPREDALITRPDCDVRVRVLPPLGYDFALSLREGATLIEATQAMGDPAFDFGTHLVGLVESGAVARVVPGQAL